MMRILDATRDELFELLDGKYITITNLISNQPGAQESSAAGIVVEVHEIGTPPDTRFDIEFDWGFAIPLTPQSLISIDEDLSNR